MSGRRAIRLALGSLAFWLWAVSALAADPVAELHDALDAWQIEQAAPLAARLQNDDSPRALYARARYLFERSDYPAADKLLARADYAADPKALDFRPFLKAALTATRGNKTLQSEHFEVRFAPGKDEVLATAALDTLESARRALGADLGYLPAERIALEIYARPEMLSAATGLPLEAIRKTGTIAICKWNRIMMMTPRVSLMGYAWRDTLNHEYTHLVISHVSANHVPIWLHEGIAKFLEERWRSPVGTPLEPTRESLLARALREDKLVTLAQMSPSMSLLPSQQHGALAYTEVLSMIRWLTERFGRGILARLLATLRQTPDLDAAFQKTTGLDVARFEENWKREMRGGRLRELAFEFDDYSILFGSGDTSKDEERELKGIKNRRGRQFMTLGKLLKDRNHPKAAAIEFEKAAQSLGSNHPTLQNYIAEELLKQGRYGDALARLLPTLDISANYLPTHLRLAEAYLGLSEFAKAAAQFELAYGINPFDPRVYQGLIACQEIARKKRRSGVGAAPTGATETRITPQHGEFSILY